MCLKWGTPLWWIKKSSEPPPPLDMPKIEVWLTNCWCCARCKSFCLLSSKTFLCEFECFVDTNVGLAAGRYSGTNRPDLYLTPHALQSVFGPIGPVLHCGVFSAAQCKHLRPEDSGLALEFSLFFCPMDFGMRWSTRVDQSQGGARERLDRAFAGCGMSCWKIGLLSDRVDEEDDSGVGDFDVANIWRLLCKFWSVEKESSTKFESHSSSAKSSYCKTKMFTTLWFHFISDSIYSNNHSVVFFSLFIPHTNYKSIKRKIRKFNLIIVQLILEEKECLFIHFYSFILKMINV